MMMNQMYEASAPLFGGELLDDSSIYWDHDIQGNQFLSVNKLPQTSTVSSLISHEEPLLDLSEELLSWIEEPVGSPEIKAMCEQPQSPVDSGIGSPNTSFNDLASLDSQNSVSDYELESLLYGANEVNDINIANQTIQVPLSANNFQASDGEINVLVVDKTGQQTVQPFTLSPKPLGTSQNGYGSKGKLKMLSSDDKKKRKRDQNKNAATRYREKKRAEEATLKIELDKLSDKNRSLADKESQIKREIHYLKELLLEVYKTKGLIE